MSERVQTQRVTERGRESEMENLSQVPESVAGRRYKDNAPLLPERAHLRCRERPLARIELVRPLCVGFRKTYLLASYGVSQNAFFGRICVLVSKIYASARHM